MDPRIRIHAKMSWVRNIVLYAPPLLLTPFLSFFSKFSFSGSTVFCLLAFLHRSFQLTQFFFIAERPPPPPNPSAEIAICVKQDTKKLNCELFADTRIQQKEFTKRSSAISWCHFLHTVERLKPAFLNLFIALLRGKKYHHSLDVF